jgi:hypothetical protein
MSSTPVRDWVHPRLTAMVTEAVAAGMDRLAVVAVITDLIAGGEFNTVALAEDPVNTPVSDIAHEPIAESALPIDRGSWFQGGFSAEGQ